MTTMSLKFAAFACLLAGVRVGYAVFRRDELQAKLADPNTEEASSASFAASLSEANPANAEPATEQMALADGDAAETEPEDVEPETGEEDLAEHEDLGRVVEASKDEASDGGLRPRKSAIPSLPGVTSGKIVLATDIDWPPYAYFNAGESGTGGGLAGFGKDVGEGVAKVCGLDITFVQTNWANCWDSNGYKSGSPGVGIGLLDGWFHGCSTFTHAQGVRNRFMEFTNSILDANKPAGLLTLLDKEGKPKVDGLHDLAGKRVADVTGWVPTADGLMYVQNQCTGKKYAPKCAEEDGKDCYTLIIPEQAGNDAAMKLLRDGTADAIFLYADQAYNYECVDGKTHSGAVPTWDCSLWAGFGKDYAYVQTGQFGHAINGTTLAISKKGSGLADILNPCIQKFMKTKGYYETCVKHDMEATCYKNKFFPEGDKKAKPYMEPTSAHDKASGCSDGYCPCPDT